MKRKTLILGFAALLLTASVSAEINTEWFENQTSLTPGNQTHVGNFQITVSGNNTTVENVEAGLDLPFNSTVQPAEVKNISNQSVNISVHASPPSGFKPNTLNRTLKVESDNHGFSQDLSLQVIEYNNWVLSDSKFSRVISLGDSGKFGSVIVDQEGNVQQKLETEITGNISEYVSTNPEDTVYPGIDSNFTVKYDIPEDVESGNYTGELLIKQPNNEVNKSVNLSATLEDTISPELSFPLVEDMEATLPQTFKVKAEDNLEVKSVKGTLKRQVENETGNKTEIVNDTYKEFSFKKKEDSQNVYLYNFKDSKFKGDYFLEITAEDFNNNTDTLVKSFEITDLEAITNMNRNFNYGEIIKGNTAEEHIFQLEHPVNVKVDYFQMTPANTSIDLKLKKVGDSASMPFKDVNSSLLIEETGTYKLLLDASDADRNVKFNGQLKLSYPEVDESRTVPIKDIFFEGELIANYPEPENTTAENLEAVRYYQDFRDGEPQQAVMKIVTDASRCRGKESMDACLPDANAGLIGEKNGAINDLQSKVSNRNYFIGFLIISFGGYVAIGRRKRSIAGLQKSQYQMDYGFSKMVPGSAPRKWDPKNYLEDN